MRILKVLLFLGCLVPVLSSGVLADDYWPTVRGHQAIELDETCDLIDSDAIRWPVNEATTPCVPLHLLYGDKIYFYCNNRTIVSCYQAQTGKSIFVKQSLKGRL